MSDTQTNSADGKAELNNECLEWIGQLKTEQTELINNKINDYLKGQNGHLFAEDKRYFSHLLKTLCDNYSFVPLDDSYTINVSRRNPNTSDLMRDSYSRAGTPNSFTFMNNTLSQHPHKTIQTIGLDEIAELLSSALKEGIDENLPTPNVVFVIKKSESES